MENKNLESIEMKVVAVLDFVLSKMAAALKDSFDPGDPESMKLLREFRATMNSRRSWIKSCGLNDENEDTPNTISKKTETTISKQPMPTGKMPVIMNKPAISPLDEAVFKGIQSKNNNPLTKADLNSGLISRRQAPEALLPQSKAASSRT